MKLIWKKHGKGEWRAHLEGQPELTLFYAWRLRSMLWSLHGAFVPDAEEIESTYVDLAAAQRGARRCLINWLDRWAGKEVEEA